MINSNFSVPFRIDRPRLYNNLVADGHTARYDSNKHASVILLFKKGVTLFVFESGTIIIIIGNSNNIGFQPIVDAFNFIYRYLLENYEVVVKDDNITNSSILRYIDEHKLNQKQIDIVEPLIEDNIDDELIDIPYSDHVFDDLIGVEELEKKIEKPVNNNKNKRKNIKKVSKNSS